MTTDAGAAGTCRSKANLRAQDPVVRDDSGNTAARAVNVGQRAVTEGLSVRVPSQRVRSGLERWAERGEGFVTAVIREAM